MTYEEMRQNYIERIYKRLQGKSLETIMYVYDIVNEKEKLW